jgi:hypothetical protein
MIVYSTVSSLSCFVPLANEEPGDQIIGRKIYWDIWPLSEEAKLAPLAVFMLVWYGVNDWRRFRFVFWQTVKRWRVGTGIWCGRAFRALGSPAGPLIYFCGYCLGDRVYKSGKAYNAEQHVRVHTGERPFICVCGKSFTQKGRFNMHASTCQLSLSAWSALSFLGISVNVLFF